MTINLIFFLFIVTFTIFTVSLLVLTYACNVKPMRLTWLNKRLLTYFMYLLHMTISSLKIEVENKKIKNQKN